MLEQELHISELIAAKLDATITEQQQRELEAWIAASAGNRAFYEQMTDAAYFKAELIRFRTISTDQVWKNIETGLRRPITNTVKLWRAAGIAAAVATLFLGIWILSTRLNDPGLAEAEAQNLYANNVAAGRNGATLTLANGSLIKLNGEQAGVIVGDRLSYTDGSEVGKDIEIDGSATQNLVAATGRGQTYLFTLPDGTKVWLNAASQIEFPASFAGRKQRKVILKGEGYFEVFKNKDQPFVVVSEKANEPLAQEVEVLGTHFNINGYDDETVIKTALVEGSVRIRRNNVESILKPGEQATVSSQAMQVDKADLKTITAWKDGYFRFAKTDLRSLMRQISRWYDIEVIYEGEVSNDEFSGVISRQSTLADMLAILKTGDVHFKIDVSGGKKRLIVTD